jgi:hypothetical protein
VDIASSHKINGNQDSKVWLLIRRLKRVDYLNDKVIYVLMD